MKTIVLSSVVTALLFLSGCGDKDSAAQPSEPQKVVKEVEPIQTETVSADNSIISSGSESLSMNDLEGQLISIYFDFDKYDIKSSMSSDIESDASVLKDKAGSYSIKLEGNCDEWGSDEYNFALGLKRAEAVKKALIAHGVDASKITMVSYGESNPTCTEKTKDCWAKNRRVDLKILP